MLPKFRHVRTGRVYALVGYGRMQAEDWVTEHGLEPHSKLVDMQEVAVYQSLEDGELWVRPKEEFHDGRFEQI